MTSYRTSWKHILCDRRANMPQEGRGKGMAMKLVLETIENINDEEQQIKHREHKILM